MTEAGHCGTVAVVGRPNVGKSTLLNRLVGQKISITSAKPQTTRYRILGIKSLPPHQIVYVDTPGLQKRPVKALNRAMNRETMSAVSDVDLVVLVVEAGRWTRSDDHVLQRCGSGDRAVLLAINKVDTVREKGLLLPFIADCAAKGQFADIVPVSAQSGDNLDELERCLVERLPTRPLLFPEDQVTDRSERFMVAEIIREKLMRNLGQELPYATGVIIDAFKPEGATIHIAATIWVERSGQKAIVVGARGAMLKRIGEQARLDIERLLDSKVFLRTWVKVREDWADSATMLREMGLNASR